MRYNADGQDLIAKIASSGALCIDLETCEEYERATAYFIEFFYSFEAAAYMIIKEEGLDGQYTPRFDSRP